MKRETTRDRIEKFNAVTWFYSVSACFGDVLYEWLIAVPPFPTSMPQGQEYFLSTPGVLSERSDCASLLGVKIPPSLVHALNTWSYVALTNSDFLKMPPAMTSTLNTFSLPHLFTLTWPRNSRLNTVINWLRKEMSTFPPSSIFSGYVHRDVEVCESDTPHDLGGWANPEQRVSRGWAGWVPDLVVFAYLSMASFPTRPLSAPAISQQLLYTRQGILYSSTRSICVGNASN